MSKHVRRISRSKILGAVAVLGVTAASLGVALNHADATASGRTATVADVETTRTFACPGRAAQVLDAEASTARLACAYGVDRVGPMVTAVAATSATARTELPAGADKGTLLVSTVLTPARSTVAMSGWTKAYDAVNGPNGLRLSAWYRVATGASGAAVATVTPAARVSMITAAFAGADAAAPIASAAAHAGARPPVHAALSGGARWVATSGAVTRSRSAAGSSAGADVRVLVNGNTRLAQRIESAGGASAPQASNARRLRVAVSGLLSVVPAPPAAVPAGAIPLTVGGVMPVTCGDGALTYALVSATVVRVTCKGAATTDPSPSPTASQTSPTPTATSPRPTPKPSSASPTPSTSTSTRTSTPTPTPTATPPAPVTGHACTSPVWRTSDPNGGWSEGGYYVHNNMWNIGKYPSLKETLEACSHASWNVTATADNNSGNGEVKTYPNVHMDYHGSGANGEPAWSSFKTLHSTFAAQGPGVGIYDVAYDIWMNGVPGDREIMIWTENKGQRPAGDVVASGVVLSGITWDVWATGDNGYLAFVPRSTLASGSLDLKAMIDYLVAHGRVAASSTLGQICFGAEVVSTGGSPATFRFTDFSVTSS